MLDVMMPGEGGLSLCRWLVAGQPAGEEPNLSEYPVEIGQDPARVLAAAQPERIVSTFASATGEAMVAGVSGSPCFAADGEVFWGDARREDALQWEDEGRGS